MNSGMWKFLFSCPDEVSVIRMFYLGHDLSQYKKCAVSPFLQHSCGTTFEYIRYTSTTLHNTFNINSVFASDSEIGKPWKVSFKVVIQEIQ